MRALRPGALPSDTAVRFLLVLSAVTAASLYIFGALWFLARGQVFADAALRCAGSGGQRIAGLVGTTAAQLQVEAECRSAASVEQAIVQVGGSLLVLLAGWLAYRAWPGVRERRAHLVEPDPVDAASLTAEIEALATAVDIDPVPAVRLAAADPTVAGFAYGAGGRLRLGMTGGLVVSQILDPPAFRAVVRHELGHVANRDVPWTYFAMAVGWAFVGLAVVPVVVLFAVRDLGYLIRLGWRTAILAALVGATVAALLRVREEYADARAAQWGSSEAMDRLLAGAPDPRSRRPRALRTHPSPASRRTLLADPDGLFTCSGWAVFAAGLSGGVAFASLTDLAYLLSPRWGGGIAALLVAPLLAAVVCMSSWRVGLREAVRGERQSAVVRVGGGLGLGLAIAPLLSLNAAVGFLGGLAGWAGYACWAAVMVVLSLLIGRWAVDGARLRVAATLGEPDGPRRALAAHVAVLSVVLALWLAISAQAFTVLTVMGPVAVTYLPIWATLPEVAFGTWPGAWVLAVLALLLVQPVRAWQLEGRPWAAWFWRAPEGGASGAVEAARQPPGPPPAAPVPDPGRSDLAPTSPARDPVQTAEAADPKAGNGRPRLRTLAAAGVGAGLSGGLAGTLALLVSLALDAPLRASDEFLVTLARVIGTGIVAAAVCAGGIAAALVPRRWWPLGLASALLAAAVAGVLAWCTLTALRYGFLSAGSLPDRPLGWAATRAAIVGPALRSLLPAALVMAAIGSIRLSRRPRAESRTAATGPLLRTVIAGVGGAVAAGLWIGLPVLSVLGLSLPTVSQPGFELVVPVGWTSAVDPAAGAAQFTTVSQDLRITILPSPAGQATTQGEVVMIGGQQAALVDVRDDGALRVLTYETQTAPGDWFLVIVAGTRTALTGRSEDVRELLDAIRWEAASVTG